jgi:hypothetical protein
LLALFPIALLLLAALAAFISLRLKPQMGYAWMICAFASLASMVSVVVLRWHLPQLLVLESWLPFSQFTDSPIFGLDSISWPYLFCLATACLAVILTATTRLQHNVDPNAWIGVLALSGMGMLAVLSANLLTLILTWTLIDAIELIILQANSSQRTIGLQTVLAFAVRVSGTVLVMVATLISRGQGLPPTFADMPTANTVLLLLAVGMRLGVLPLNLSSAQTPIQRRGLGLIMRFATAASALVALARLPANGLAAPLRPALLAFCALAGLYAATVWASARDEIQGRPYWLIGVGALAVASVVQGHPEASPAWGVALLLPGGLLFLFSARRRSLLFLPALGLLAFSGLPFTPAASGWQGVLATPFNGWQILLLAAHALLMLGYVRFLPAGGDDLGKMERWVQVVYPLGLSVMLLADVLIGLIGWRDSFSAGLWWAGAASAVLAAVIGLASFTWRQRTAPDTALNRWYTSALRQVGGFLFTLLSFTWLYRALWRLYRFLAQGIQVLTEILEGEGGVLWAMVLLALLVSLLQSRLAR